MGLLKRHIQVFHEVGDDKCSRPRYTSHAVNEDVSVLTGLVDELGSSVKVHTQVVLLVVLPRYIQRVWHLVLRVPDVNVFAGCKH